MPDDPDRMVSNTPVGVEDSRLMPEAVADITQLLCHLRKTPNVLYGIFLELTKQFYSDDNNIPIDVCVTWDPDSSETGIWIDTEYKWEDETVEFRPAIYVKLGDIAYSSLTGRHDGLLRMDLEQGEYHYSRNGKGTVSWVHIGSTKGESIALSGATLDYLDAFAKVIRDDFCFQTFELVSLSPMQMVKESKESYRSVVTFSFTFEDTWSLKLESPKLKRVLINAGQGLMASDIV